MCLSATVFLLFIFTTQAQEHVDGSNGFNTAFVPSTVNFNEIFTNSLALAEDIPLAGTKEEDFHLPLPSQFVEFRPLKETTTSRPTPPPRFAPNPLLQKHEKEVPHAHASSTHASSTSTTPRNVNATTIPHRSSTVNVDVIPINQTVNQRGVLDLLFPAVRVKGFKHVFDTIRRLLSHTFRR